MCVCVCVCVCTGKSSLLAALLGELQPLPDDGTSSDTHTSDLTHTSHSSQHAQANNTHDTHTTSAADPTATNGLVQSQPQGPAHALPAGGKEHTVETGGGTVEHLGPIVAGRVAYCAQVGTALSLSHTHTRARTHTHTHTRAIPRCVSPRWAKQGGGNGQHGEQNRAVCVCVCVCVHVGPMDCCGQCT